MQTKNIPAKSGIYRKPEVITEESLYFKIDKKGKPQEFIDSLNDERDLYVRCVSDTNGIEGLMNANGTRIQAFSVNKFCDFSWNGSHQRLKYLRRNEETGELIKDGNGLYIPETEEVTNQDGSLAVRQKFYYLNVPSGGQLCLKLPYDKFIIMQLLKCPNLLNLKEIDGKSTIEHPKMFFIYDPAIQSKQKEIRRKLYDEAYMHSRNLTERDINAVIATLSNENPLRHGFTLSDRFEFVLSIAKENPALYIDKIIKNDYKEASLIRLMEHFRIIQKFPDGVYMYVSEGRNPIVIGSTEPAMIEFFRNHSDYRREACLKMGYEPSEKVEVVLPNDVKTKQKLVTVAG